MLKHITACAHAKVENKGRGSESGGGGYVDGKRCLISECGNLSTCRLESLMPTCEETEQLLSHGEDASTNAANKLFKSLIRSGSATVHQTGVMLKDACFNSAQMQELGRGHCRVSNQM